MNPPDQPARDAILGDLDTTFLVEAAAGTGKTTCMVGRMIALVREGRCPVENLAAVTFTRKAGAELRTRFQAALEQAVKDTSGKARENLDKALARVERCYIGTIHSFCARLLRERPVEAGVDMAFEEIEDVADAELRQEAWEQYRDGLYATDNPLLARLNDLGLTVRDLQPAFETIAEYPDVADWPHAPVPLPDLSGLAAMLLEYARHMRDLLPTFPEDFGANKIMPRFRTLERAIRHANLSRPAELMGVLELFGGEVKSVHRNWPGGKDQAAREHERWNAFIARYVSPTLATWRQHRYEAVIEAILPAVAVYDRLRQARGLLNFQDLLLRAAALLRDKPAIRHYFRRRFTHLLVDEFQDTDPIQAEVMLLLTADDVSQTDWRKCRPAAGSLFVVGDPKQSIYRFRRADIVTYNQVKQIIAGCGRIASLTANFRCDGRIIDFVNARFADVFNNGPDDCDGVPRNVPLEKGLLPAGAADLLGVQTLLVPEEFANKGQALEYDADFIARFIRNAIDNGRTVARTPKQLAAGLSPAVAPGDFLILSYRKGNMQACARRLQELGIPCEITGGATLNQVSELDLLHRCLQALLQPDNPIALVAALRGELFGFSDPWLYAFVQKGGHFSFRRDVPDDLDDDIRNALTDAFDKLRRYASWLNRLPAATAIERIAQDLGLFPRAAAREGGDVQCGSLAKAIELLRSAQATTWTAAELADSLGEMVAGEVAFDGISARPPRQTPVRIMNLHKAKGLEAPVVLLACPAGKPRAGAEIHVDRGSGMTRGYLRILGPRRGEFGAGPLLAEPIGWADFAAREQAFLDAEQDRLRYVAATRAGSALIISQRQKKNDANFWKSFEDADLPVVSDPGAACHPQPSGCHPQADSFPLGGAHAHPDDPSVAIAARWQAVRQPSSELTSGKQTSSHYPRSTGVSPAPGEHGTEWGTVIHALLEALAVNPSADISALAHGVLAEHEMPPDLLPVAVETAQAVTRSDLWARAMAAAQRLVEVPFFLHDGADESHALPRVVRGVIDLAFQEADGWVIADYKTDAVAARDVPALVDYYRPQLAAYAQAWQRITGQAPKETGLYLTRLNRYANT